MTAVRSVARTPALEPVHAPHETEAARRLYERYADRVFRYCQRRLRSREEAEDALQTTFLHALRGLRRGVVPDAEVAWLLKIAHSVCLTRWETARRAAVEVARDPHVLEEMLVATAVERDELIPLPEALERLTENQRRAILLREWQGLSYREIAEELELSQAAVETLIFRARKALAQGLSGEPKAAPRRTAWAALDLASAFAAVRSIFSGGATLKVATAVAVVGATLGTGGALERPSRDQAPAVPGHGDVADLMQLERSPGQGPRVGAVVHNELRPPGPGVAYGSRRWAPSRHADSATVPPVDARPLAEQPAATAAPPSERVTIPVGPVVEPPQESSSQPADTRPSTPEDGSLVGSGSDPAKPAIEIVGGSDGPGGSIVQEAVAPAPREPDPLAPGEATVPGSEPAPVAGGVVVPAPAPGLPAPVPAP